jgi:serine/threonine protein kinase
MSKQALSFMDGLLAMDPKDRLTSREAMFHAFFDGLRSEVEERDC